MSYPNFNGQQQPQQAFGYVNNGQGQGPPAQPQSQGQFGVGLGLNSVPVAGQGSQSMSDILAAAKQRGTVPQTMSMANFKAWFLKQKSAKQAQAQAQVQAFNQGQGGPSGYSSPNLGGGAQLPFTGQMTAETLRQMQQQQQMRNAAGAGVAAAGGMGMGNEPAHFVSQSQQQSRHQQLPQPFQPMQRFPSDFAPQAQAQGNMWMQRQGSQQSPPQQHPPALPQGSAPNPFMNLGQSSAQYNPSFGYSSVPSQVQGQGQGFGMQSASPAQQMRPLHASPNTYRPPLPSTGTSRPTSAGASGASSAEARVSPASGPVPLPTAPPAPAPPNLVPLSRVLDSSSFLDPTDPDKGNESSDSGSADDIPLAATRKRKRDSPSKAAKPLPTVIFAGLEPRKEGEAASPLVRRAPSFVPTFASARGSMRAEVSKLMWAAGDAPNPRSDAVDLMEDMVIEFLSDLCHPAPPVRANSTSTHHLPKLSAEVVRYRLARTPKLKTYLDRWDYMHHMTDVLQKTRRILEPSNHDLVHEVGADFLGVDEDGRERGGVGTGDGRTGAGGVQGRKQRRGGPRIKSGPNGEKLKPGPKKGWKKERERAAAASQSVEGLQVIKDEDE